MIGESCLGEVRFLKDVLIMDEPELSSILITCFPPELTSYMVLSMNFMFEVLDSIREASIA